MVEEGTESCPLSSAGTLGHIPSLPRYKRKERSQNLKHTFKMCLVYLSSQSVISLNSQLVGEKGKRGESGSEQLERKSWMKFRFSRGVGKIPEVRPKDMMKVNMERVKGETEKCFPLLRSLFLSLKYLIIMFLPPLIPKISITTKWGSAEGRRVENKVLCHEQLIPRVSPPHSLRYCVQTRKSFMSLFIWH